MQSFRTKILLNWVALMDSPISRNQVSDKHEAEPPPIN